MIPGCNLHVSLNSLYFVVRKTKVWRVNWLDVFMSFSNSDLKPRVFILVHSISKYLTTLNSAISTQQRIVFRACRNEKLTGTVWTSCNSTELEQVVQTHQTSYRSGCLYFWIVTSVLVGFSRCNSSTSSTVRIPLHTTTKSGTEKPIRYGTNYFQDRRSVAHLRFVTEFAPKSLLVCVNRSPIRYGFHAGAKDIRYSVNKALGKVSK